MRMARGRSGGISALKSSSAILCLRRRAACMFARNSLVTHASHSSQMLDSVLVPEERHRLMAPAISSSPVSSCRCGPASCPPREANPEHPLRGTPGEVHHQESDDHADQG